MDDATGRVWSQPGIPTGVAGGGRLHLLPAGGASAAEDVLERQGWPGPGAMGLRMARRPIRATHDATAYDPVPAPLDLPKASGERPASASADADAVFVAVATPEQSMAALFGSDGAAGALAPGAPVVVMRTIGPASVRELTDRRAPARVGLLDAPMSGGVARAEKEDPVVMVGGPRERCEICLASLDRLGTTVAYVGEAVGDGQALKLVNQMLVGVHIAATTEVLGFAAAPGPDPRAAREVVRHGAAGSFMLDDRGARMLGGDFEPVRSAPDIFVKDMGLVVSAAKARTLPTPLAALAEQLYLAGTVEGLGRRDDSSLITLYGRWVGQSVPGDQAS